METPRSALKHHENPNTHSASPEAKSLATDPGDELCFLVPAIKSAIFHQTSFTGETWQENTNESKPIEKSVFQLRSEGFLRIFQVPF